MQEGLKELETLLDPYDWFYEVVEESFRYIVYVTTMNPEQDTIIPNRVCDKQVVVHFANSKTCSAQDYIIGNVSYIKPFYDFDYTNSILNLEHDIDLLGEESDSIKVPNISFLCQELDRLEKQCGSNILQDIFYEVHDQDNAVTNLRSRYPEVKTSMQKLYNEYGFDAIYNELDG